MVPGSAGFRLKATPALSPAIISCTTTAMALFSTDRPSSVRYRSAASDQREAHTTRTASSTGVTSCSVRGGPGIPKRYLQDLLRDDDFGQKLGVELSPETSHVFLCGNPAMIDDMVAILAEDGFREHSRKQTGEIFVERYW